MFNLLNSWFGRSSRLVLLLLVLSGGVSPLVGCSKVLPSLLSGGPNVAANVQAGKTNTQTLGQTNNIAPSVSVRPNARVDSVDQSTNQTTNQELPTWVWIAGIVLLIIGWITDTPSTIVKNLRKRK